jgi:hypothetical protein
MNGFRNPTLLERIVTLETRSDDTESFKADVRSRLRRIEFLLLAVVAMALPDLIKSLPSLLSLL